MKPRTKPLRSVGPERRKLRKEVSPDEKQFLAEFDRCFYCGRKRKLSIDHIARGAHRKGALSERAAWNASCWPCNSGDPGNWTVERKLKAKRRFDPEFYDREAVNRLRGRAPGAITEADVDRSELDSP